MTDEADEADEANTPHESEVPKVPEVAAPKKEASDKLGQFVEKYTIFLSSFVLGLAGLVGTCMHQRNQTAIEQSKAKAQIESAKEQAQTQWQIARAEILSKHLQTLLDRKPETTDQRYGVLLSLTRGDVIDPELAMSYAFDLDNAEYIKSVVLNIKAKSYEQIFSNFRLTCPLRFGVWKDAPACTATDAWGQRADALTDVVEEDLEHGSDGPAKLLADDRFVRENLLRLAYLFRPYLELAYERQRFADIEKFEKLSAGAEFISSLVLAGPPSRTEPLGAAEAGVRGEFHRLRKAKLEKRLLGSWCDAECRGIVAELLLNELVQYGPVYADVLKKVLLENTGTGIEALSRLHHRLLWCQLAPETRQAVERDVLLPALKALSTGGSKSNGQLTEELTGLLALVNAPPLSVYPDTSRLPADLRSKVDALRPQIMRQREHPPTAIERLGKNFCVAKFEDVEDAAE